MPKAEPCGEVHDVFKERLTQLRESAKKAYEGYLAEGQRSWCIPTDLEASDLFAIPELHKPSFDREKINTNFCECISDSGKGTVGDIISLTTQNDYNAAEERAFRLRHASPVRLIACAAARQRGKALGPGYRRIEEDAANAIAAGAAKDKS